MKSQLKSVYKAFNKCLDHRKYIIGLATFIIFMVQIMLINIIWFHYNLNKNVADWAGEAKAGNSTRYKEI